MNWDQVKGKWTEMSGRVRQQWGKITDSEVEQIKGDRDVLAGKIQHQYGVTKDEAERQIDDWLSRH